MEHKTYISQKIWFFILLGIFCIPRSVSAQATSCPELEEVIAVEIQNCSDEVAICFPIALADYVTNDYTLTINGEDYTGTHTGCDFDSIVVYNYFTLLGQGEAGPYHLDTWMINGVNHTGQFNTIEELLDSMNLWDPTGMWEGDSINPNILGGDLNNIYSDMVIEQLQLPGTFATLGLNYGQTALGTNFFFPRGTYNVVVTNNTLACTDEILIHVACLPTEYVTEEVYLGLSGNYCIESEDIIGNMESYALCSDTDTENVQFFFDDETGCMTYLGESEGQSTICAYVCDDLGFCDTTILTVNVVSPPEGEVIVETIVLGESGTECLSADELEGPNFELSNICEENSGENVQFSFNEGSLCVDYEGISVGLDTACILICEPSGLCDTVTFYISVIDPVIQLPQAEDDSLMTPQNESILISVLENDTIEYLNGMNIISQPTSGEVFIDVNHNISYQPYEDYCGFDYFTYEICNAAGCDTAQVEILVNCDEVKVFNGFSPNDDGVNDRFRVLGLEAYPNCNIKIFNTWGNMVYESNKNEGYTYEKSWDGTFNGKHLPDGNYFYFIELGDGSKRTFSGYVLVHR